MIVNFAYHQIQNIPTQLLFSKTPIIQPPMQSASFALSSGVTLNHSFAHGLGSTPNFLRCVLLCTSNDSGGFIAGQEYDLETSASGFDEPSGDVFFGASADSTNIYLTFVGGAVPTGLTVPTSGTQSQIADIGNFSLKVYYNKFS